MSFDLIFEDARENFDTVTIGYDSLGWPGIDPEFGEFNIENVPFDSVFEVRGADKSGFQIQSNPIIDAHFLHKCAPDYHYPQYQSVIIRAKHWPVTIHWNQDYFYDDCYDWTHFTRIWSYLFNPSFINGDIALLNTVNSLTVTKNYIQQTNGFMNNRTEPIIGGGQDSVYVIWIGLSANMPTNAVEEPSRNELKTFPNPTNHLVNIALNEKNTFSVQKVLLHDLLGNTYEIENWMNGNQEIQFNTMELQSGFYLGTLHFKNGKQSNFKFLKQ